MLTRYAKPALVALFIVCAKVGSASTTGSPAPNQLYGHISSNRTLTVASPGPAYEVIGDLTIDPGATLSIERGVSLTVTPFSDYLASGANRGLVEIVVFGALIVPPGSGSVTMHSGGAVGCWRGIEVLSGGTVSLSDCSVQHTQIAVQVENSGTLSLARCDIAVTRDGVNLQAGAHCTMSGSKIVGDFTGTGVTTAISLTSPDSITASPTFVLNFATGCYVSGSGVAVDHIGILDCSPVGIWVTGSNVTLAYCTVWNNLTRADDIGVYDAGDGGTRFYNSIVSRCPRPITGQTIGGMYCNYVDAWTSTGSVFDPFGSSTTGNQNASFDPFFAPDFSLSPVSLFTNFSVSGGQIGAYGPGPVGPTPILAANVVDAVGTGGVVRIRWFSEVRGSSKAGVFRRTEGSDWQPLTVLYPDGRGYITLEDRDVLSGARYGYGVGVQRDSHVGIEGEVWVNVEASVTGLGLAEVSPNPATTSWSVAFSSPGEIDSRIEVLDLGGRIVRGVGLRTSNSGRQVVSLPAQGLSPGMYWIRVHQGGQSVFARAIKMN